MERELNIRLNQSTFPNNLALANLSGYIHRYAGHEHVCSSI